MSASIARGEQPAEPTVPHDDGELPDEPVEERLAPGLVGPQDEGGIGGFLDLGADERRELDPVVEPPGKRDGDRGRCVDGPARDRRSAEVGRAANAERDRSLAPQLVAAPAPMAHAPEHAGQRPSVDRPAVERVDRGDPAHRACSNAV